MKFFRAGTPLALVLVAILIPACGEHSPSGNVPEVPVSSGATTLRAARLSGGQEVPPVSTPAIGNATVTVNPAQTEVSVVLEVTGLTDITEAHIHFGDIGIDGPIIFSLASGPFTSPLNVTLTTFDFIPQTQGVTTFDSAVQAMMNGRTYVNVHTAANPDGEIRGQVGPVMMLSFLDGAQETPPVETGAVGNMSLQLSPDQTQITYTLSQSGLVSPITAAHIHAAPPGVPGPIIFPLTDTNFTSPLTGFLSAKDLTPQSDAGVVTFEDAIDAMLTGKTYANIHTTANPNGEIRGQIQPPIPTPGTVPPTPTSPTTPTTPTTPAGGGVVPVPVYSRDR